MSRRNPTDPTAQLKSWPMEPITRTDPPTVKLAPKIAMNSREKMTRVRANGIVRINIHFVKVEYNCCSIDQLPVACSSAIVGEKIWFTDCRAMGTKAIKADATA